MQYPAPSLEQNSCIMSGAMDASVPRDDSRCTRETPLGLDFAPAQAFGVDAATPATSMNPASIKSARFMGPAFCFLTRAVSGLYRLDEIAHPASEHGPGAGRWNGFHTAAGDTVRPGRLTGRLPRRGRADGPGGCRAWDARPGWGELRAGRRCLA